MKNKVVYKAKINKAATNLVMDMLNELYDNPEAAVLREYVSNAYKANTDAKATRRVEPKTHNLSFDQKVFLAALVSRDRKFLSKKDAKKIIKRLKLLFPDEFKLIKDCADEIAQKVKL